MLIPPPRSHQSQHRLVNRLGFAIAPLETIEQCQAGEAQAQVFSVLRSTGSPNCHRILQQWLSLTIAALIAIHRPQSIKRIGDLGMAIAQPRSQCLYNFGIQRGSLGIAAHQFVQHGQVVNRLHHIRMAIAQLCPKNAQGFFRGQN